MTQGAPLTRERLEQWRAVQPQGWRGRVVPAALWTVIVVLATALSSEGGCSAADPCGPDWVSAVEVVSALAAPVLLLWWPPLGTPLSLVAAGLFVLVEVDLGELPLWLAVVLPAAAVAATVEAEVRSRARAAAAARLAAGVPVSTFPGPAPEGGHRSWQAIVGAVVLLAVPFLLGYGVVHGQAEAGHERGAAHVRGTVVSHGDDGYLITVSLDGRREQFDTYNSDDYPVGSEQDVLLLPDGRVRLGAERYDPSGWLAGAIAAGLLGSALLGRARRDTVARRRLLSRPQPVHAVRLASSWEGAQVLAVAGDADPLLQLDLVPADPLDDGPGLGEDEDPPRQRERVTATLYGVPVRGELVAVVLDDGLRLLPTRPARKGDPAWREQWAELDPSEQASPLADDTAPTAEELGRWREQLLRPERGRTTLGLVLVVGAIAAAFVVARQSDGVFTTLWRCGLAASFAFDGLVRLATRVSLTPEGLVHDGPTTRRTVPWAALEGLTVAAGDAVLVRTSEDVLPLTWLPHRPRFGGKGRRRAWARRWAAVLAEQARSAPSSADRAVSTEPRLHAAVTAIAFTAAVLVGLWSRGGA